MKNIFICCFLFITCFSFSQQNPPTGQAGKIDSLQNVLETAKEDTGKVNTLNNLSRILYQSGDGKQARKYADNAMILSEKLNFKKGKANAYNHIGNIYNRESNYPEALRNHFLSLEIQKEIGNETGIANSYNNIGYVYLNFSNYPEALKNLSMAIELRKNLGDKWGLAASYNNIGLVYTDLGNYPEALKSHLQALKIREEINNKEGIAYSYNNIGLVYANQGNYSEALKNYLQALKTNIESGDRKATGNAYNNIGNIYLAQRNYSEGLKNHLLSLKINEEIGNKKGVAGAHNSIGTIYFGQGNYPEALKNYLEGLKIAREIGDKLSIAAGLLSLGKLYSKENKTQDAEQFLLEGLRIAKEIGGKEDIKSASEELSKIYSRTGNFEKAYEYLYLYSTIKDTLLNTEKSKQLAELQTLFETEKKEKEIELLTKDKALQEAEANKQKFIRNGFIGGLIFVLLLALLIYNRYVTKQKLNAELSNKNNELTRKNTLIESQNEKIIDNIIYAQRIQQSILTDEQEVKKYLPDSFIYNQPKDIVSGDFYWFSKVKDKIIITAIDCTGHGVSGAFMSMIGNTLLNQIVNEKGITTPSEILAQLNIGVYNSLHQDKHDALSHDGMDMALCSIDHKSGLLEYAGAQNPLYVVADDKVQIITAGLYTIGGGLILKKDEPLKRSYENHTLSIKKGMSVYLFSDGYTDQFGGNPRKKFGHQRFRELLIAGQKLDMEKQRHVLATSHQQWKGNNAQTDDVLVMGLRF